MNQGRLSDDPRGKIAALLHSGPIHSDDDKETLFSGVEHIIGIYKQQRLLSRDSLPTAPELLRNMEAIEGHLGEALKVLTSSLWTLGYLDPADGKGRFKFAMPLLALYKRAHSSAEHLRKAVKEGSPLIITEGGVSKAHKRKTRTDARDRVLIKGLVFWLELRGYDLNDLEHLDSACAIIEAVLTDQNIPCPDAGETGHGEHEQGKLRRLIKTFRATP